jgi:hypothetical protein
MRIFRKRSVASELQQTYGYQAETAHALARGVDNLPWKWNKLEMASWLATSEAVPEGNKAGELPYLKHCETVLESKFYSGKISFNFMINAEQRFDRLRESFTA